MVPINDFADDYTQVMVDNLPKGGPKGHYRNPLAKSNQVLATSSKTVRDPSLNQTQSSSNPITKIYAASNLKLVNQTGRSSNERISNDSRLAPHHHGNVIQGRVPSGKSR